VDPVGLHPPLSEFKRKLIKKKLKVSTAVAMKSLIFWSGVIIQKTELYDEVSCGRSVMIVSCF
jgi:hypothetical protein